MSRAWIWKILIVIAAAMLLVANLGFWVDRNIVDSDTFITTTAEQIDGEQARMRVAEVIVLELIGDQPLVYRIFRERAEQSVATVLATPALQPLLAQIATTLHQMVITGERPVITIGPAFLPQIIAAILEIVDRGTNLNLPTFQIEIELFTDQDIQSIERFVDPLEAVRLPFTVAGVLILALAILVGPDRRRALRWVAISLLIALAITLVGLFIVRTTALANIDGEAAKTIVSDVLDVLISRLIAQSLLVMLVPAAILLGISLLWRGALAVMPDRQPADG